MSWCSITKSLSNETLCWGLPTTRDPICSVSLSVDTDCFVQRSYESGEDVVRKPKPPDLPVVEGCVGGAFTSLAFCARCSNFLFLPGTWSCFGELVDPACIQLDLQPNNISFKLPEK